MKLNVSHLFSKMDTPVASAHSRQISLDPRMCVNELLFLYRALSCCFGLLHCMAFTISDGKKKHIKKQYKSKPPKFVLSLNRQLGFVVQKLKI